MTKGNGGTGSSRVPSMRPRLPINRLHLRVEHLFQPGTELLVRQECPVIELFKATRYLLSEPYIVIYVMFNDLLHIFVSAASNIRSDAVELCLQFRAEVHFHDLRVARVVRSRDAAYILAQK